MSEHSSTHLSSIPLVDLRAQYRTIQSEINLAIQRVLDRGEFILGEEVSLFEKEFAAFSGSSDAVGVASGTAALHLALLACGIRPGDEVITTAHSFIATAEAISYAGAKPVFVDIDPRTYTLNPDRIESLLTPKTKTIIPVHLYGQMADMKQILPIAQRHSLKVIEDAAQSHGAERDGYRCGNSADAACFSFYPSKNLGAYGDAGAVTSRNPGIMTELRKLRDHGRKEKYVHERIGYAEKLDALQASVLRVKLKHLKRWTQRRRYLSLLYRKLLAGTPVVLPQEAPNSRHVYHLFVIRAPQRDRLLVHLKKNGIFAGIHYPLPLHLQPAYASLNYKKGALPATEKAASEVLSLPLYPELTEKQVERVVGAVRDFYVSKKSGKDPRLS